MRAITLRVREPANGLTHLTGLLLSVIAMGVLLTIGVRMDNARALIGLIVFGLSQIALYTASTLHHSLSLSPRGNARLLRFDCTMVVVLIAGTYTPLCLLALHGVWRWGLLGAIWGLVVAGLIMMTRWMDAPRWASTMFYILLGWIGVLAAPALFRALPTAGVIWMFAGGAVYTVGALIFVFERPNPFPGTFDAHALWHLFVLGGSACCFWLIVRYVVPLG
ncbi:MAG: hemolysin III family protein [Chloroflexota bacterium]|nr:hemolysin III family protein [Chloroflexota bacterium]